MPEEIMRMADDGCPNVEPDHIVEEKPVDEIQVDFELQQWLRQMWDESDTKRSDANSRGFELGGEA